MMLNFSGKCGLFSGNITPQYTAVKIPDSLKNICHKTTLFFSVFSNLRQGKQRKDSSGKKQNTKAVKQTEFH